MEQKSRPIYWVLIGIVVVGLLALALRPMQTETRVLPPLDIPEPADVDPEEGLVIARIRTGGTSIFGLEFGSFEHRLDVQFYAPPGCFEMVNHGDHWPPGVPECSTGVVIEGELSGGGIAATGESIINVLVDVSGDCYEVTPRGASWPLTSPECAGASG